MRVEINIPDPDNDEECLPDIIELHDRDTWALDETLGKLIVPLLKQLKDTKHGIPVEFGEDVYSQQLENWRGGGVEAWNKIMDKMIWSFEQASNHYEGENKYYTPPKKPFQKLQKEDGTYYIQGGKWDIEAANKWQERVQEGFDLFAKYYMNLWD